MARTPIYPTQPPDDPPFDQGEKPAPGYLRQTLTDPDLFNLTGGPVPLLKAVILALFWIVTVAVAVLIIGLAIWLIVFVASL